MEARKPLLSICIPTMNRAKLLEIGLMNVLSEIEPLGDEVELIVTDNGFEKKSLDSFSKRTPRGIFPHFDKDLGAESIESIVHRMSGRIRYSRLEGAPVVFTRSFLHGPCNVAQGEYVWVIGDDDLIVRGGVARILSFLKTNPDIDYVHLNNGWIDVDSRNYQINYDDSRLPTGNDCFQINDRTTKILDRFEDLVFLETESSFALFSGIFTFVARRSRFLQFASTLQPTDDWKKAIETLDNLFPHSKLVLAAFAGKPVGYIGEPCFMQGVATQEDHNWLYKTLVYGHVMLFEWLENTAFDRSALRVLWRSLAYMAGRYQFSISRSKLKMLGQEIVRKRALPRLVQFPEFVQGICNESQRFKEDKNDASDLTRTAKNLARCHRIRNPRIVVWGVRGRGYICLAESRWTRNHTILTVDRSPHLQGRPLINIGIQVEAPEVIRDHYVDILILATRRDVTEHVLLEATTLLNEAAILVSLLGAFRVCGNRLEPLVELQVHDASLLVQHKEKVDQKSSPMPLQKEKEN